LVQHVQERAEQARLVERVVVATDDERVVRAVEAYGGTAMLTGAHHPNGTSRIAEIADQLESPMIVNIQGDEPEIEPGLIDLAIETLAKHPECPVATIASPFEADEDPANRNIVKVVTDQAGRALYFSRAWIPHDRDGHDANPPLKHVGLYVYRRPFLAEFAALPPTPLEQAEQLEQLRMLEHGFRVAVAVGRARFHGIDTPEQYEAFVKRTT
jgi:3-deoxy-manno-octulosonate cytidylyltransferase (CMP-KDO synthetase)